MVALAISATNTILQQPLQLTQSKLMEHTSRCWNRAAAVARPATATKGAAWRNADDDDRTVLAAAAENCRRVEIATACRLAARTAAEANIIVEIIVW